MILHLDTEYSKTIQGYRTMIIFYNKTTGQIIGTIEGRITTAPQLNMWVGNKEETDRIIIDWKPTKYFDKAGNEVASDSPDLFTADYEADHEQKELFADIEKRKVKLKDFKVDIKTKNLVKIEV